MMQMEAVLTDEVQAGRALVAHIGRILFDRHLTDSGGGNISLPRRRCLLHVPHPRRAESTVAIGVRGCVGG